MKIFYPVLLSAVIFGGGCLKTERMDMKLVDHGVSKAPIVLATNASRSVVQAANDLAIYIEKISGARPDVVKGNPDPLPEHAVWVGPHPRLAEVFPDRDFKFRHPEEILIACNGRNLVITGNGPGAPNAVYTFIQDNLDVRRLWPGPLGEDVIRRESIAFAPFEYRYHPQFRQRDIFRMKPRAHDRKGARRKGAPEPVMEADWMRFQRNQGSLQIPAGSHAFNDWWDRFHKDHSNYFALQPDGTRSGYPGPKYAKLCDSNPDVWDQWLKDAAEKVKKGHNAIRAHPGDAHSSGICVCKKCLAWDNPKGAPWKYTWAGTS